MVNTELLENKIIESGKKKKYLSEKLGISIQAFSRKCLNKNEFKLSEVQALCKEINVSDMREMHCIFFA